MGPVLVVDKLSPMTKRLLRQAIEPDAALVFSDGDASVIGEYIGEAAVLVTFTDGVPADMAARACRCLLIQKLGSGVNNIACGEAAKRGIRVANVPDTNSRSVAELALTLLLALYRQVVRAHVALARDGLWLKAVLRDTSRELTGKTVGIVGLGSIGIQFAKLLRGFDCEILYTDIRRLPEEKERELGVTFCELGELLRKSDAVSLHCPLNESTRHLINEERLRLMKPDAVLVNCARGAVVEEGALVEALRDGTITGAAIDTFEEEPIDNKHPLAQLPNVILSPHNGGGTVEAVTAVVRKAAENINAVLTEGPDAALMNVIHPEETRS